MSNMVLTPHAFVLAVNDLAKSSAYFINVLGFDHEWSDGADWQGLVRGSVRLRIGHCPDAISPADLGDHSYFAYIETQDIDRLFDEFSERGAIIRSKPDDKEWGWREMAVGTPEGHRIMFAEKI